VARARQKSLVDQPITTGPGESREIPGGPFPGHTELMLQVTVQTPHWTNTETIWVWIDGDITIQIGEISQYGISYWQEPEWWG
jgi:hypothetical protein